MSSSSEPIVQVRLRPLTLSPTSHHNNDDQGRDSPLAAITPPPAPSSFNVQLLTLGERYRPTPPWTPLGSPGQGPVPNEEEEQEGEIKREGEEGTAHGGRRQGVELEERCLAEEEEANNEGGTSPPPEPRPVHPHPSPDPRPATPATPPDRDAFASDHDDPNDDDVPALTTSRHPSISSSTTTTSSSSSCTTAKPRDEFIETVSSLSLSSAAVFSDEEDEVLEEEDVSDDDRPWAKGRSAAERRYSNEMRRYVLGVVDQLMRDERDGVQTKKKKKGSIRGRESGVWFET